MEAYSSQGDSRGHKVSIDGQMVSLEHYKTGARAQHLSPGTQPWWQQDSSSPLTVSFAGSASDFFLKCSNVFRGSYLIQVAMWYRKP